MSFLLPLVMVVPLRTSGNGTGTTIVLGLILSSLLLSVSLCYG